jgi:hypothetical protein
MQIPIDKNSAGNAEKKEIGMGEITLTQIQEMLLGWVENLGLDPDDFRGGSGSLPEALVFSDTSWVLFNEGDGSFRIIYEIFKPDGERIKVRSLIAHDEIENSWGENSQEFAVRATDPRLRRAALAVFPKDNRLPGQTNLRGLYASEWASETLRLISDKSKGMITEIHPEWRTSYNFHRRPNPEDAADKYIRDMTQKPAKEAEAKDMGGTLGGLLAAMVAGGIGTPPPGFLEAMMGGNDVPTPGCDCLRCRDLIARKENKGKYAKENEDTEREPKEEYYPDR